jgi:hypothetical protein
VDLQDWMQIVIKIPRNDCSFICTSGRRDAHHWNSWHHVLLETQTVHLYHLPMSTLIGPLSIHCLKTRLMSLQCWDIPSAALWVSFTMPRRSNGHEISPLEKWILVNSCKAKQKWWNLESFGQMGKQLRGG